MNFLINYQLIVFGVFVCIVPVGMIVGILFAIIAIGLVAVVIVTYHQGALAW
jgi:hypothetical protein